MKRTWITLGLLATFAWVGAALAVSDRTTATGMQGIETRIEETATQLDSEASRLGDDVFAGRLGTQLDVSADVLIQERTQFGADWGDLLVAHTLLENARTSTTLENIFVMRQSGMNWTQIAMSLRVPPGRLLTLVRGTGGTVGGTFPNGTEDGSARSASSQQTGIDRRILEDLDDLDNEATRVGDATIAERFSEEFDVTTDVLLQQKTQFNADWSDLFIAYTILERARTSVTLDQIFAMRASGQSWMQIARSLRIPPGQLMKLVRSGSEDLLEETTSVRKGKSGKDETLKADRREAKAERKATRSELRTERRDAKADLQAQKRTERGSKATRKGGATAKGGTKTTVKGEAAARGLEIASTKTVGKGQAAAKLGTGAAKAVGATTKVMASTKLLHGKGATMRAGAGGRVRR